MRLRQVIIGLVLMMFGTIARAADEPVCLVTGFDIFGGLPINESWETARKLNGRLVAGYRIAAEKLPVVYDEVAAPLTAALEKHKPVIVIGLGVGSEVIQLETIARNGYHPMQPLDNNKRRPPRRNILPEGPATIRTGLPTDRILAALKEAKIGAVLSEDAGGYLCNEAFYRLMAVELKKGAAGITARGFIHVPMYGKDDPEGGAFTPEKLERAIVRAIEVTAKSLEKKPE